MSPLRCHVVCRFLCQTFYLGTGYQELGHSKMIVPACCSDAKNWWIGRVHQKEAVTGRGGDIKTNMSGTVPGIRMKRVTVLRGGGLSMKLAFPLARAMKLMF